MKNNLAISDGVCYTKDAVNESGCLKGEPMNRQPKEQLITAAYAGGILCTKRKSFENTGYCRFNPNHYVYEKTKK